MVGQNRAVKRIGLVIVGFAAIVVLTVVLEFFMGRTLFGPSGQFGWWCGDIWSNENSQRLVDPYTLSHLGHGILFFGLLWLIARKLPPPSRFLIATLLEAGWEVLENSPIIINRYRAVTISLGYNGDSILNSCSDIVAMALAFCFAARVPWKVSALVFVALELIALFWIRDNLILNIIMLIHPFSAIKTWQMGAAPAGL